MGGELLGDLLPSGQLDVFQSNYYSDYSQRAPHQVSRFCYGLQPDRCKTRDIHGSPHRFWGLRGPPQRMGHHTRQKPIWPKGRRPGMV